MKPRSNAPSTHACAIGNANWSISADSMISRTDLEPGCNNFSSA